MKIDTHDGRGEGILHTDESYKCRLLSDRYRPTGVHLHLHRSRAMVYDELPSRLLVVHSHNTLISKLT
jgi:hypothetical protein